MISFWQTSSTRSVTVALSCNAASQVFVTSISSFGLTVGAHMTFAGLTKWTLVFLLLLLPLSGDCRDYGVNYPQPNICTVKNSTVDIPCTFFYPSTLRVVRVLWAHERNNLYDGPFLFDSDNTSSDSRFQYHGDKIRNCSLAIHHVGHNDSGKYAFRFVTDYSTGKYSGVDGSTLRVVDLTLSPSSTGETKEGDSLSLTCRSNCDGAQESFVWLKDRVLLRAAPVLDLSPLSPSDSGIYTCSLSAHPGTTSGVKLVDVEYGPKNTSASPPTKLGGSRNVSLVCSSRANPPVQSYAWFRIKDGVQEVGRRLVLVTGEDGEYFCSATNKHGSQNSSAVTVKIRGNWPYATYISITVAMVFIVIAVILAVIIKKKTKRAPEIEDRQNVQNQTYFTCSTSQSAKTSQAVQTPETADVIYTSVQFASSRGQQKHLTPDEVIYSTVRI